MTRRLRILAATAIVLALVVWSVLASGQNTATGPPCGNRADMVTYLKSAHGELSAGHGLRSDGLVLELFVGPTGSWSVVLTHPNGFSCLVSFGEAWEMDNGPWTNESTMRQWDSRLVQ
jgi:hypothetical protein